MMENKKRHSIFIQQLIYLGIMMVLLLSGATAMPVSAENTQSSEVKAGPVVAITHPGTDLWREVRQRSGPVEGTSQVKGTEAGSLINPAGETWQNLRIEKLAPYSAYLIAFVLAVTVGLALLKGPVKIEGGRSGKRVKRFSLTQRTVHWVVTILFFILGITGIVLLLGRKLLIPVLGHDAFSVVASVSKTLHDYCGPVFGVALVFMLVTFIKGNFYNRKDITWFAKGGGFFGKHGHAPSGFYNAGEKTWFWLLMVGGTAIVGSGMVLNFPNFEQTRGTMQLAHIIHLIAAVIVFAVAMGHTYMATFMVDGALETMTTGYCDANWAKEHHDEWYEEVKGTEEDVPRGSATANYSAKSESPGQLT